MIAQFQYYRIDENMRSPFSGKKVLVTGADGFIGSHVSEQLVAAGAQVTGLAQYNATGTNGWLDDVALPVLEQIRIVRGDIRDGGFIRQLVPGHEIVFHLAALIAIPYSYVAPQSYVDVNVTGTLNVLEACRAANVERLVHTSTSEVYGTALTTPISEDHPLQAQSPYSASKMAGDMMAEAFAKTFDQPVVTLRPFNTYGPRQSERAVIPTIIRQAIDPACDSIAIGDLSPKRDFNYVGDTVAAFLEIAQSENVEFGEAYNSGSGYAVSIKEVVDIVVTALGANKPVVEDQARIRPKDSEVRLLLADASRFESATHWRSGTDLESGLNQTIDWWRLRLENDDLRKSAEYLI